MGKAVLILTWIYSGSDTDATLWSMCKSSSSAPGKPRVIHLRLSPINWIPIHSLLQAQSRPGPAFMTAVSRALEPHIKLQCSATQTSQFPLNGLEGHCEITISLFSLCSTEMRARAKLKEGRLERKEQESLSFKGPEWRGSNSVHDYLQVSLTNCAGHFMVPCWVRWDISWPLLSNLQTTNTCPLRLLLSE